MANEEWVHITHPDVGDAPNPVTRQSFDLVWSKNRWTIKGESTPPESRLPRKTEGDK